MTVSAEPVGLASPESADEPRRASLLGRVRALLVGSVLAVATAELVLRHYCYVPKAIDPAFGPAFGYVNAPGATARWEREGSGTSHWSARGVRGRAAPDPARPHILCLGDSFTEGLQVDDDEVYTARLERLLAARGFSHQVLNSSDAGAAAPRYVGFAPRYRQIFAPRWTVVQVRDEDFGPAAWVPDAEHFAAASPDAPLRVVLPPPEGAGGLVRRLLRRLRSGSALTQTLTLQIRGFQNDAANWHPFHAEVAPVTVPPVDPSRFRVSDALDLLFDGFGGRLTLLYLADRELAPPSAVERLIARRCRERGWSCIDTREAHARMAQEGIPIYGLPNNGVGRGHMNPTGHRLLAELVAAELARLAAHDLL